MAPTDLINGVLNITSKLVNVRELYIYLWDLPPLFDLQPLFSSFWSSFGPKLYTLSFLGRPEDFRTFISSNPILGSLCVELTRIGSLLQKEASRAILIDLLLPFINNLAPRLLSLKLWSRASFFHLALNVRTTFNTAFGDASGLKRLICDSSDTLQRVDLHVNPARSMGDPSSEEPLSRWILEFPFLTNTQPMFPNPFQQFKFHLFNLNTDSP